MSNEQSTPPQAGNGFKLPSWLVVVLIVGFLGFGWWQKFKSPNTTIADNDSTVTTAENANDRNPVSDEHATNELASETTESSVGDPSNKHAQTRNPHSSEARSKASGPLSRNSHRADEETADPTYKVENQSIRDLNGKIVFKGTIDLKPTLNRIERSEANRHRNDGTSFQNREGHLPKKAVGYYKEYVHPTPGEHGPGPQRIILGKEGEIWYTPDHYKTFKQIKRPEPE